MNRITTLINRPNGPLSSNVVNMSIKSSLINSLPSTSSVRYYYGRSLGTPLQFSTSITIPSRSNIVSLASSMNQSNLTIHRLHKILPQSTTCKYPKVVYR